MDTCDVEKVVLQQNKVEMDVSYVGPKEESGFCSNDTGSSSESWVKHEGEVSDLVKFGPDNSSDSSGVATNDEDTGGIPWKATDVTSISETCDISAIKPNLIKGNVILAVVVNWKNFRCFSRTGRINSC